MLGDYASWFAEILVVIIDTTAVYDFTIKNWPRGDKWDEYYFFGGEDYELVFSLPKKWANNLTKLDKKIYEIGYFTDGEPSIEFKDKNKNQLLLRTPFKHF